MKAMILAAGRGERMRPISDRIPKALLEAGGKPLILWHIEKLARAGFREIVINHAHLGHMIETVLGSGIRYGVDIQYSAEAEALETAGGIANALPLLGDKPFLAINADIYTDFSLSRLLPVLNRMGEPSDCTEAHLVLVPNPAHHPRGDFALEQDRVTLSGNTMLTFSGIGLYRPGLFAGITRGAKAPLGTLLRQAISRGSVSGQCHEGFWMDIGTPERLQTLNDWLAREPSA